jgi:hypothetical protein
VGWQQSERIWEIILQQVGEDLGKVMCMTDSVRWMIWKEKDGDGYFTISFKRLSDVDER